MASARLIVNLEAVRANYATIQRTVGLNVEVAGVVKADAYGLGAKSVSRALHHSGCNTFFVATAKEASIVRAALPSSVNIITLTGYDPRSSAEFARDRIIPAIASLEQLANYRNLAQRLNKRLPYYLQFCTGMNRLGLCQRETDDFWSHADALAPTDLLDLRCVMTHAACADFEDPKKQDAQLARFHEIAKVTPAGVKKSFANSYSIFRDPKYHFDLVRPGMSLYGLNPLDYKPNEKNPMRRTVTVEVPVAQIRFTSKGDYAGYCATWVAPRDSVLATLGIGYADGLPRAVSNKAMVYWTARQSGTRYTLPIRGRVSMDSIIVDLTDLPEADRPKHGEYLSVVCDEQDADALAAMAGTIGYEILTSLGRRFERVVVGL